ncbi:MAG: ABC transporter substrate-binding protein [Chloroflexota bacterium]
MKEAITGRTITRRQLLKAAALTAGASVLAACSTPAATPTAASKATEAPKPVTTVGAATVATPAPAAAGAKPVSLHAPEANIKKGGVLRVAGPSTVAHYDFYAGVGWPMNLWMAYNGLVRLNLNDGLKTIVPDLAEKWDITGEGKIYTFKLKDGVKFQDGSVVNSDDVITTFTKILNPPQGIVTQWKDYLAYVDKVEAVDKLTVRFTLKQATPFFLEVLTGGSSQNFGFPILSKKQIESNNYDLRKVNPMGTGPFRLKEMRANEKIIWERNPDYFDKDIPYVDGIELIHVPQMTDRGTAVLAGQADMTLNSSVDVWREAQKQSDKFVVNKTPSLASHTCHINNTKKPLDDPRVRRAMFLVVSRQNIFKAYQDQEPITMGRWMPDASPFATPAAELEKIPGYRPDKTQDIADAKKLMADAGYPNGFGPIELVTANAAWAQQIMAPAYEQELRKNLNITTKTTVIERSLLADNYVKGTYDLLVETKFDNPIADPTPMWNAYLKTGGSQNVDKYSNKEFDTLLEQINKETDDTKRKALFNKGMDMLDQNPPFIITGFTQHSQVLGKYVKGLSVEKWRHSNWGRLDTVWLDK